MKIAIVHELLTMRGGAERVLKAITEHFPDAPIFTLLYDEKKLGDWFPRERIHTPIYSTHYQLLTTHSKNHHLYLSQFPRAVESWDFSEFDVVLSFSSAFAHGIITNGKPKHLCYVHSPARYLWDRTHDVLDRAETGCLGRLKRWYLERLFHRLRIWDSESAYRPDALIAASKEVQSRIKKYWRRESSVIYPHIDDHWLLSNPQLPIGNPQSHFLIISTLSQYKRIDLAIDAANRGSLPLKIVGEGPDRARLESLAGPTVEFLGYRPDEELRDLLAASRALIIPGDEDFALTPLEAMSQGTPVIAYRKGGPLETIQEHVTGTFFDDPTAVSLLDALERFDPHMFRSKDLQEQAEKFSRERFIREIEGALATVI